MSRPVQGRKYPRNKKVETQADRYVQSPQIENLPNVGKQVAIHSHGKRQTILNSACGPRSLVFLGAAPHSVTPSAGRGFGSDFMSAASKPFQEEPRDSHWVLGGDLRLIRLELRVMKFADELHESMLIPRLLRGRDEGSLHCRATVEEPNTALPSPFAMMTVTAFGRSTQNLPRGSHFDLDIIFTSSSRLAVSRSQRSAGKLVSSAVGLQAHSST